MTIEHQFLYEAPDDVLSLFPELHRDLRDLTNKTGTLPCQDIAQMVADGVISAGEPLKENQIQPSSLDLRLGPVAYRAQASFLPGERSTVKSKLRKVSMAQLDISQPTLFERGCVYIVPLLEELRLPKDVAAKANPRSTTGRLDVFTRLITEYGTEFERVPPGYRGRLYAEILPRTFSLVLRKGVCLNQLRFLKGTPPSADTHLTRLSEAHTLVYDQNGIPLTPRISKGLRISVNLRGEIGGGVVGYKAKNVAPAIDFCLVDHYDPRDFWEPVLADRELALVLNPGDFYILASRERVSVPPHFAAEMVPFDPAMGEFRVHYAGFFDPGFGYGGTAVKGAKAVLEVRSHVPFLMEDGQTVGRLVYERLTSPPTRLYGSASGSSYQGQGLLLSKQFQRG